MNKNFLVTVFQHFSLKRLETLETLETTTVEICRRKGQTVCSLSKEEITVAASHCDGFWGRTCCWPSIFSAMDQTESYIAFMARIVDSKNTSELSQYEDVWYLLGFLMT